MSHRPAPVISADIKRYLPWLVAVALFMENLDATIVNTAVPTMALNLNVEPLSLKAVLTSYTLSLAVFIPVSGWMADRFGTRRIFTLAISLFLLGSVLCGISSNVPMLVASRIIQGMGGAIMTPVGRLTLVRTFPRSEMLAAMNYVVVPALIGPLLGPFVGGLIVHWLHWRVIFFLNVPFALGGLWLVHLYMPDFRDDDNTPPLDRAGFLLFGSGVALLSYVLEIFGEHTLPWSAMGLMLAGSAALFAAYHWHSQRVAFPVLALRLFLIRTFRVSVIGGFVTRLGVGGMPFLLPLLYPDPDSGYLPWQAGLLTMPAALAAIGMKIVSKQLLARFGHRQVLIYNTVLLGLTMVIFTQIGAGCSDLGHPAPEPEPGIFLFAAVHQHEHAGLRRCRRSRCEQGQQHLQHGANDVPQFRRRVRLPRGGGVSGPRQPERPGADHSRPAQGLRGPRLHHDDFVHHLLGLEGQRREQRQQPGDFDRKRPRRRASA